MLNKVLKNDIAIYTGTIPRTFCKKIIGKFKVAEKIGEAIDGTVSAEGVESYRSDDFLVAKDVHLADHTSWDKINVELHREYVLPCLRDYLSKYKYVLEEASLVDPTSAIMSCYERGKGKFAPHKDAIAGTGRSLTVICYFNTVKNGGETEFFNQGYKVAPFEGNVLIFPSNFVYAHQGLMPVSEDKYIMVSFATVDIGSALNLEHMKNNDKSKETK